MQIGPLSLFLECSLFIVNYEKIVEKLPFPCVWNWNCSLNLYNTFYCLKTNEYSYTAVFHLFFLILTYALGLIANSFLCIILIFNCSITGKADLAEKYCRSFNSVYPSVCLPMCKNANLKRKLFLYLSMYLLYKYIINILYYIDYMKYSYILFY